jgi:hypothetical protein
VRLLPLRELSAERWAPAAVEAFPDLHSTVKLKESHGDLRYQPVAAMRQFGLLKHALMSVCGVPKVAGRVPWHNLWVYRPVIMCVVDMS